MLNKKKLSMVAVLIFVVVFFSVTLTGCSLRQDKDHATIALTTSTGESALWNSYNGAGMIYSGKDIATSHKQNIVLKKGETALLTFHCDACGDLQEYKIKEPFAQTIYCKCPKEINKKGNAKEYFSISISFKE